MASLLLASADGPPPELAARRERIEQLSETKELLERELAASVPALRDLLESQRRPHTELEGRLPSKAVLIDTLRYWHFEEDMHHPRIGRPKME